MCKKFIMSLRVAPRVLEMPSAKPAVTIRLDNVAYSQLVKAAERQMRTPANFVAMVVMVALEKTANPFTPRGVIESTGITKEEADERFGQLVCTGRADDIACSQTKELCERNGLKGWQPPELRPEWRSAREAYLDTRWNRKKVATGEAEVPK